MQETMERALREFLKETLEIRVSVEVGSVPYEDQQQVVVKAKLLLFGEEFSESEGYAILPTKAE